jgi:hypothetical protein
MAKKDVFLCPLFLLLTVEANNTLSPLPDEEEHKVRNKKTTFFSSGDIESLGKHAVNKCYS